MILGITGHRYKDIGGNVLPNPTYNFVCSQIEKQFRDLKPEKIITGMALGADLFAASIANKLQIPFIAAIPFADQEACWKDSDKKIYHKLIDKASEVLIISEGGFANYKYQIRNQYIVDNSDKLLAIWNGTKSGTGNCVEYAKKMKKEILIINPLDA
jgi:uncharacterized phage-like protein YoqJ